MFCRIQKLTPDVQLNVIGDTLPESMRAMVPPGVDVAAVDAAWKRGPERVAIYPELQPNEISDAIIHIVDVITASGNAGATNPLYLVLISLLNGVGVARSERDQFRSTIEQLVAANQAMLAEQKAQATPAAETSAPAAA